MTQRRALSGALNWVLSLLVLAAFGWAVHHYWGWQRLFEPWAKVPIALVALVSLFLNEDYRPGVYGTLVYFVIGIVYFGIRGRHKLVLSPEEEFAMSHGQRGANLQEEGYGRVSVTEIAGNAASATPGSEPPTRSP
jgi:hypothetical protein